MLKIKNKRANVPNGYLYVQRESGWDASKVIPHTISDFYAVCRAIQAHRSQNPSLGLNTSMSAIEAELEAVTVARIAAIPGAGPEYLQEVGGAGAAPSFTVPPQHSLQKLVAAAQNLNTGKDILFDWEKSGQPPVTQELANKRSEVCVACLLNGKGGLSRYFTLPAAALIQARLEKLHAMKMVTPFDNQLGVCGACTCPLKLKVWTPIDFIEDHMTDEQIERLDPACWVLREFQVQEKT